MGIGGDGDILLLVVMLTAVVMVAVLIGEKFFICRLDGCVCGFNGGGGGNSGCGGSCLSHHHHCQHKAYTSL